MIRPPIRILLPAVVATAAAALLLRPDPPEALRIPEIQGRSHVSPALGRTIRSSGVVTAVVGRALHVQDPGGDGDPATSDAVVVTLADQAPPLRPGDEIRFTGVVAEEVPFARQADLSGTVVIASRVERLARGRPLPAPVAIGGGAPVPPSPDVISSDELPVNLRQEQEARASRFDPTADAIDWFESLEAMRVVVRLPVAISAVETFSPRSSGVFVLPDGGRGISASRRTAAGGILLQSGPDNRGSQNPERIQLRFDSLIRPGRVPRIAVGDRLSDATGVVRYDFGNYEVALTDGISVEAGGLRPEATGLIGTRDRLTLATYNVLNLSAGQEDARQRALLAEQIVHRLRSPDIVALQEIQDNSGETDDGTTDAGGTLRELTAAIRSAGGPAYRAFDVPPPDGRGGGAPGGNIRNAFLLNPARVRLVSFGLLVPGDSGVFRDSRDPLIGVFEFQGRRITVINNHLTSRFGSTPVFGAVQPFIQAGEEAREAQVRALHDYVAGVLARDPGARIALVGDMNTFEFTDDLARLLPGTPPVLHPLAGLVPAPERYSYNFEGNSQLLDHVFVSAPLRPGAELDVVHLNVDFPSGPDARASDHEPLVARLRW